MHPRRNSQINSIKPSAASKETSTNGIDFKSNIIPPNFTEQQQKWLKTYLENVNNPACMIVWALVVGILLILFFLFFKQVPQRNHKRIRAQNERARAKAGQSDLANERGPHRARHRPSKFVREQSTQAYRHADSFERTGTSAQVRLSRRRALLDGVNNLFHI